MYSSTDHRASYHRSSAIIALWVAVCLLFAQWLGYAHAISHAGSKSETASVQVLAADKTSIVFDHQKASSACAALDGATLGAGLHSATVLSLLLTFSASTADCILLTPWQQSFAALFSSRAPPLLH